jgi:RNA polymerase sigma-70 factor (ECF subfamily)
MNKDTQLIDQLKKGNPKAVKKWYSQYHDQLLHFVLQKINLEGDAEELVQDVFLNCLKHLPLFRGEASIWTWMVRIAQHEVADYYRKRYAKKFIHLFPLSEFFQVEEVHNAHDVSAKVHQALRKMTAENREVLLMKYVDKKKVKQIATELGKTVKSIESILFRARLEFKSLYLVEES